MSDLKISEYKSEIEKLKRTINNLKDSLEASETRITDSITYANKVGRQNNILKKRLEEICNITIGHVNEQEIRG